MNNVVIGGNSWKYNGKCKSCGKETNSFNMYMGICNHCVKEISEVERVPFDKVVGVIARYKMFIERGMDKID